MLIALVGCDGAGKTTLVRRLGGWLIARGEDVSFADKWDVFDREAFPNARFLRGDRGSLARHISCMPGVGHALFIFWTIALTVQRQANHAPSTTVLLDGYWAKHLVSESLYGTSQALLEQTVALLPIADLTVYLDVSPEDALRRKGDFVPYECGLDPECKPESFIKHQRRLRAELTRLATAKGWPIVPSSGTPDETFQHVLRLVEGAVARRSAQVVP